jgi:hypothetical protein
VSIKPNDDSSRPEVCFSLRNTSPVNPHQISEGTGRLFAQLLATYIDHGLYVRRNPASFDTFFE